MLRSGLRGGLRRGTGGHLLRRESPLAIGEGKGWSPLSTPRSICQPEALRWGGAPPPGPRCPPLCQPGPPLALAHRYPVVPPRLACGAIQRRLLLARGGGRGSNLIEALKRNIAGVGAGLVFCIFKAKWVLTAMKLLQAKTLLSMLLMFGMHTVVFGWQFAAGSTAMLVFHECGHAAMMVQKGHKISGMAFVPFLGAAVTMSGQSKNAEEAAYIALAGPWMGGLAAGMCLCLGIAHSSQCLMAVANFGMFINLLNLVPMRPLDGGTVADAIHPGLLLLGVVMALAYLYFVKVHIIMVILTCVGIWQTYMRFHSPPPPGFTEMTGSARLAIAVLYLLTAAVLFSGWYECQKHLKSPKTMMNENKNLNPTLEKWVKNN